MLRCSCGESSIQSRSECKLLVGGELHELKYQLARSENPTLGPLQGEMILSK